MFALQNIILHSEPSATDLEPDHKKVEKEPIHTLTFLELKQQK